MAPVPKIRPLPKVDLEPFEKAVNAAAERVRALWLGYIALLAYLFVAVGAVTHRALLLQPTIKLPILNVELPLLGFFAIAPILLLINHFYLLLQLLGLGRRVREFNDEIAKADIDEHDGRRERRRLDTFVIVQMLGGTKEERQGLTNILLRWIAFITLVLAPVALLLFIQLRFLPYQLEAVTWLHRIALGVDLALLWAFWPSIKLGDWAPWWGKPLRWAAVVVVMIFACVVATFPGEFADGGINAKDWSNPKDSFLSPLKGWLFGNLDNKNRTKGQFFLARALDLHDTVLIDQDKYDKIKQRQEQNNDQTKSWETRRTLSLRGRHLRGANFKRSDLRDVDLHGAQLEDALLIFTRLQDASLDKASLEDASLDDVRLEDASLDQASLQGAFLNSAHLQGASLFYASLQGASLISARLQGAWLFGARLQGAWLSGARLQGALLDYARLQGASLDGASLQGASLDYASLQGASLGGASLQGASLDSAYLSETYGSPHIGDPVRVWVKAPNLKALTADDLAKLKEESLSGVEDNDVKQRIMNRLERLSAPEKYVHLPDNYWTSLAGKMSLMEHQTDLADRLVKLACDEGPNVVLGLTKPRPRSRSRLTTLPPLSHLEDVGSSHLPSVAKTLLDAAEGKTTGCPGVKGLNAASIAKLREWAAGHTTKVTNPAPANGGQKP